MRFLIVTIFLGLIISLPVSARMYKWVDEEGNVTYSQTPPPADGNVTEEKIDAPIISLTPNKKGKDLYCGRDKLPGLSDNPATTIFTLEENIISWSDNNINVKEQRAEYVRNNAEDINQLSYVERMNSFDEEIRENDCKIDWARVELKNLEEERIKITENHENIGKALKELEARKTSTCGYKDYEGFVVMDDDARGYFNCIEKFDREISKMKKELRNAEKQKEMISY